MKKTILSCILCLAPFLSSACDFNTWFCDPEISVQGRVAYFHPESDRMRRFYDDSWVDYQLELSSRFSSDWGGWVNLAYTQDKGHSKVKSLSCHQSDGKEYEARTYAKILPINIGIKRYFCHDRCFRPYIGAGVGAVYVRIRNKYDYVERLESRWGVATLLKLGMEYDLTRCVFIDAFADWATHFVNYDKKRGNNSQKHPQTGGLKLGMGIGYHF